MVEQSGIQAGAGGFDVNVAGNTDLKGAYIASTAEASKNQLTTGTLTFSDIENHSEYSANSFGFGGGFSIANGGTETKKTGPKSGTNKGGISPMLPQSESGNERATTHSGVSEGTITLTDGANQKQDLASLKRETMDLNGTVSRTPDLQELLNDQSRLMSAATAAGEAVARDIGTYASKKEDEARKLAEKTTDPELKAQYEQEAENWKEGGDYRALMHAAGGAIVAGLGGGNALGGALGAGATSKLGDTLNKLSADIQNSRPTGNADVDEALAQIVATGIGTAVGAAMGGSSGAFTGFNTDRYNRQLHASEEEKLKALQRGKTPEEQYRYAAALCADARCADGIPDSDPNRAVLLKMQTEGAGFTAEREMLKRAGVFEGYSLSDTFNDAYDRYQVGGRAIGALQGVTSAAIGAGALGVGCPTVVACGSAAAIAVTALDYSKAGFTRAVTGGAASTYGEQALQSLGVNPEAAAMIYSAAGLGLASTLAIGRKVATLPGAPIFSTKGALGSQALAGPVGTGSISAGINAAAQYAQKGEIDSVSVIGAFVAGTAGHGRGLLPNVAINGVGGATTTAINNAAYGQNDSIMFASTVSAAGAIVGYGAGKGLEAAMKSALRPTINSSGWADVGKWSGPSGLNLFTPNNLGAIGASAAGGSSSEATAIAADAVKNQLGAGKR